jgi:hypothetical protein
VVAHSGCLIFRSLSLQVQRHCWASCALAPVHCTCGDDLGGGDMHDPDSFPRPQVVAAVPGTGAPGAITVVRNTPCVTSSAGRRTCWACGQLLCPCSTRCWEQRLQSAGRCLRGSWQRWRWMVGVT